MGWPRGWKGWGLRLKTSAAMRRLSAGKWMTSLPVSYTHLDVYKRQGLSLSGLRNPFPRPSATPIWRKSWPLSGTASLCLSLIHI